MTPWTLAHQTPLSMEFCRRECWSGIPFPSPAVLPNPGIKLGSPTLEADFLPSEPPGKPSFSVLSPLKIITICLLSSVQSLSRVWLFAASWITARQASLSITNSWSTHTHVHWGGDAIQLSHPLSAPSPPAPNPSQPQGLFQWVNSSHEVDKVLEFQLQHQSFQWTPRTDLL